MMTDFDVVYEELYDTQRRIYSLETEHPSIKEEDYMTKIITYTIILSGGEITAATADDTDISQYQEVIIRANLTGFEAYSKKALKISISSPSFSAGISEEDEEDFEYTIHMIPIVGEDLFELRLNELLGTSLTVGELNTCPLMFTASDCSTEYDSNITSIDLYKTNLDTDYVPDDMSNIFITIAKLNTRLLALEED